jgi:phage terminase large subunit GpA-like protein
MDAFTDPLIREITVMKSARVGFTQSLVNNAIGYTIDLDPADAIVLRPTEAACKKWSKSQFDSMVQYTPTLAGKVYTQKTRSKHNEILHKFFKGGELFIVPATSPVGLSDLTAKFLFADEVDRFVLSAGMEGDPVALAEKRTLTVWGNKVIRISSPTIKGISRIESSWLLSSQQHYRVHCPHCKHDQILIFGPRSQFADLAKGMLKYDSENLTWWYYECENCRKPIEERFKLEMISGGHWQAQHPEITDHAGFHINELYSLLSTRGWRGIIKEFIDSKNDTEKLQVWVNTVAGEVFERDISYEYPTDSLLSRREDYENVPDEAVILTAGIDTQDDRFEVVLKAWGKNNESWFMDRFTVHGSPDQKATRDALDEFLQRSWKNQAGVTMHIDAAAFDSGGHFAQTVYKYVRDRKTLRYYSCKGVYGFGKNIIHKDTRDRKLGARLIIVGVDTAKQLVYDRLKNVKEKDQSTPQGLMHFNHRCDKDYFDQLTAEKIVIKRVKGMPVRAWELKQHKRNEMLDCEVLNIVALLLLSPNFKIIAEKMGDKIKTAHVENPDGSSQGTPESAPTIERETQLMRETVKKLRRFKKPGGWNVNI